MNQTIHYLLCSGTFVMFILYYIIFERKRKLQLKIRVPAVSDILLLDAPNKLQQDKPTMIVWFDPVQQPKIEAMCHFCDSLSSFTNLYALANSPPQEINAFIKKYQTKFNVGIMTPPIWDGIIMKTDVMTIPHCFLFKDQELSWQGHPAAFQQDNQDYINAIIQKMVPAQAQVQNSPEQAPEQKDEAF